MQPSNVEYIHDIANSGNHQTLRDYLQAVTFHTIN